jgi:glycosyltransferase involved in cell wall biosynthesis
MPDPLISVIVPVYNGEACLAEALSSILRQAYAPLELIVVDDGSTDGTAQVTPRFPAARTVFQPNAGVAAARNYGLRLARGEVIAFLDADDVWSDDKLPAQGALLAAQPEADLVLGQLQMVSEAPYVDGRLRPAALTAPWQGYYLGAALIRRAAFDRAGLFDETLGQCEDLDWFLRTRELGVPWVTHSAVTLYYRQHRQNMSLYNPQANQFLVRALKKSLDRRRQRPA